MCSLRGSRFYLKLPAIKTGSCAIRVKFDLKDFNGIVVISIPSIKSLPYVGSIVLRIAWIRVDFPAPVLPTTPIF